MTKSQYQLRLLTLNCWGLKYLAKDRDQRINAIARVLSTSDYDIVALQEIWVLSDYELVQKRICNELPYSKFFHSGVFGAGLAIFSRFPMASTSTHTFSLNGAPLNVFGDWFAGRCVASIVVRHPVLGEIQILNTHIFAEGYYEGPEFNRAHRLVQAWEFAKIARQAAELGRYVVALGDFNSVPTTLPMAIIREHSGLADVWQVTHPIETKSSPASSTEDAIARFGVTCDSPLNFYTTSKLFDSQVRPGFYGIKLDYILYRQPSRLGDTMPVLQPTDCQVALTGKIPNSNLPFSDHFGVEATLEIQTHDGPSDQGLKPVSSELSSDTLATFIQVLTETHQNSLRRSRKELVIGSTCLVLLFMIAFGSKWLPYGWNGTIFLVLTAILSWLSTTMLYSGFLYGRWESSALVNLLEELEIHEDYLESQPRNSDRLN